MTILFAPESGIPFLKTSDTRNHETAEPIAAEHLDELFKDQIEQYRKKLKLEEEEQPKLRKAFLSRVENDTEREILNLKRKEKKHDAIQLVWSKIHMGKKQNDLKFYRYWRWLDIVKEGIKRGNIKAEKMGHDIIITNPAQGEEYLYQHLADADPLGSGKFLVELPLNDWTDLKRKWILKIRDEIINSKGLWGDPLGIIKADLVVSSYVRFMEAQRFEQDNLIELQEFSLDIMKALADVGSKYTQVCFKQLIESIKMLEMGASKSSYHQTGYSKSSINMQSWGRILVQALVQITEKKEENITIKDIREAMKTELSVEDHRKIQGPEIGYLLRSLGVSKLHLSTGLFMP